jgi:hypothetical protein
LEDKIKMRLEYNVGQEAELIRKFKNGAKEEELIMVHFPDKTTMVNFAKIVLDSLESDKTYDHRINEQVNVYTLRRVK